MASQSKSSNGSSAKAGATKVKTGAKQAKSGAKQVANAEKNQALVVAETAVDLPVGAVLSVRDRVGELVEPFTGRTTAEKKIKAYRSELRRTLIGGPTRIVRDVWIAALSSIVVCSAAVVIALTRISSLQVDPGPVANEPAPVDAGAWGPGASTSLDAVPVDPDTAEPARTEDPNAISWMPSSSSVAEEKAAKKAAKPKATSTKTAKPKATKAAKPKATK